MYDKQNCRLQITASHVAQLHDFYISQLEAWSMCNSGFHSCGVVFSVQQRVVLTWRCGQCGETEGLMGHPRAAH